MNLLKYISAFLVLLLILPVAIILVEGFGPLSNSLGYGGAVWAGIELSLFSSSVAALLEIIFFTPLAYYLARNRSALVETLVDIPVSIPHPIVGIALLLLDSRYTVTGRFLNSIGVNFFNTIPGLVSALVIISAPIYVKSMQSFFESMPRGKEYFAMGLGASNFRTFLSVVLPNSGKGIMTASLTALSRAMSEFGSIAIVAYFVLQAPFAGVTPASVLVYQYYESFGLNAAVTASAVMISVSVVIMVGLRAFAYFRWPKRAEVL